MKSLVKMIVLAAIISLSGSCFAQCNVRCQAAFKFVVSHEDRNLTGVVSPEPFGGVARFGVNSHAHPEAIRAGFYRMSKLRALRYAQNLFYKQYWSKMDCDQIQDYHLAYRVADLAYNLGPIRATILLQRALNELGSNLVTKGYLGQDTIDALSNQPSSAVNVLLKVQAVGFYSRLARKHTVMRAWKAVWMARLAETEEV
jgi:lysozyme family protein